MNELYYDEMRSNRRRNNKRPSCKRRRNRRMHSVKFFISITMALMLCLAFGSIFTYAKPTREEIPTYKYFKSIEIDPGQTLTDIANTYMTKEYANRNQYIKEVMNINHLSNDQIHAGCYIVIPYYSEEVL